MRTVPGSSESRARRNSALASAPSPIADFLANDHVVEVMGNADDAMLVGPLGEGRGRGCIATTERNERIWNPMTRIPSPRNYELSFDADAAKSHALGVRSRRWRPATFMSETTRRAVTPSLGC